MQTHEQIQQRIAEVLLTAPGERLDQPEFGVGLRSLVFEPIRPDLNQAVAAKVREVLQRFLGDIIQVEDVAVEVASENLQVEITYVTAVGAERRTYALEARI